MVSDAREGSEELLPDSDLTDIQFNILVILGEQSRYGLAVIEELRDYYESDVTHSKVYPNLDKLAERGLITISQRDGRTNEYALSSRGYETLLERIDWTLSRVVTTEDRAADVTELLRLARTDDAEE